MSYKDACVDFSTVGRTVRRGIKNSVSLSATGAFLILVANHRSSAIAFRQERRGNRKSLRDPTRGIKVTSNIASQLPWGSVSARHTRRVVGPWRCSEVHMLTRQCPWLASIQANILARGKPRRDNLDSESVGLSTEADCIHPLLAAVDGARHCSSDPRRRASQLQSPCPGSCVFPQDVPAVGRRSEPPRLYSRTAKSNRR